MAGLSTTVFPMARAGQIFQVSNMRGKFHGTIAPTTPKSVRISINTSSVKIENFHQKKSCLTILKFVLSNIYSL